MNEYVKKRKLLLDIYESRDKLLKELCNEIDLLNNSRSYGASYYAHVKQTLTELESGIENVFHKNANHKLAFPQSYEFINTNFDFEIPVSGIDMTSVHSTGIFEPAETVLLSRISYLFKTFIDVGANIGYHSFLFKKFSNEDSNVFAFEPEKFNSYRLSEAIKQNHLTEKVFLYKLALSDKNETLNLLINKRGAGGHTLVNYQAEILCDETEKINCVRLDDFVNQEKIEFTEAILKIDVEGADVKVITGAENQISNGKFPVIFCEIWDQTKTGNYDHQKVFNYLIAQGYIPYTINYPVKGASLLNPTFIANSFNKSYNDNYVFIKSSRKDLIDLCLKNYDYLEAHSVFYLSKLIDFQEECILETLSKHAEKCDQTVNYSSKYLKHYISSSDGGYPILRKDECNAEKARRRFHHNCGGPALLSLITKANKEVVGNFLVGRSKEFKDEKGHYSVPIEDSTNIVIEDAEKYKPDLLLLMPNNVTSFTPSQLQELKRNKNLFIAARDGDPSSYQNWRVDNIISIAKAIDLFITVDGETFEKAQESGCNNIEYIPSFVNEHLEANDITNKSIDILFTGIGHSGQLMDNGKFMYDDRRKFIKKVDATFPGSLKVFGHQWGDCDLNDWRNEFISEDYVHQLSGKSKIVIAFDGPYSKGFTSVRMFRIMMSGAFVLVRYFPGIENLFENKKHIAWFHGDEEGLELIKFYLNDDKERERIAKQGKDFLLSKTGWRRKNIIVDYLFEKLKDPQINFNILNPSFYQPIPKPNSLLNKVINEIKKVKRIVNLRDIVTYAEGLIEQDELIEAENVLKSVLDYDPNYLEALNDLTIIMILKNNIDESIKIINKVLSLDNDNELAKNNLDYLKETTQTLSNESIIKSL